MSSSSSPASSSGYAPLSSDESCKYLDNDKMQAILDALRLSDEDQEEGSLPEVSKDDLKTMLQNISYQGLYQSGSKINSSAINNSLGLSNDMLDGMYNALQNPRYKENPEMLWNALSNFFDFNNESDIDKRKKMIEEFLNKNITKEQFDAINQGYEEGPYPLPFTWSQSSIIGYGKRLRDVGFSKEDVQSLFDECMVGSKLAFDVSQEKEIRIVAKILQQKGEFKLSWKDFLMNGKFDALVSILIGSASARLGASIVDLINDGQSEKNIGIAILGAILMLIFDKRIAQKRIRLGAAEKIVKNEPPFNIKN